MELTLFKRIFLYNSPHSIWMGGISGVIYKNIVSPTKHCYGYEQYLKKLVHSWLLKCSCELLFSQIRMGSSPLTRKLHEEHDDA